jgi:hypothetical protein
VQIGGEGVENMLKNFKKSDACLFTKKNGLNRFWVRIW